MTGKTHKRAMAPITTPAELKREVSRSPHFASMYTNDIQFQLSAWDMRLIFGEISEPATPEHPVLSVMQIGEVRMSPEMAKRVVSIMAEQLKAYETKFGPIPSPAPDEPPGSPVV